jgi:hypothetical protein
MTAATAWTITFNRLPSLCVAVGDYSLVDPSLLAVVNERNGLVPVHTLPPPAKGLTPGWTISVDPATPPPATAHIRVLGPPIPFLPGVANIFFEGQVPLMAGWLDLVHNHGAVPLLAALACIPTCKGARFEAELRAVSVQRLLFTATLRLTSG